MNSARGKASAISSMTSLAEAGMAFELPDLSLGQSAWMCSQFSNRPAIQMCVCVCVKYIN